MYLQSICFVLTKSELNSIGTIVKSDFMIAIFIRTGDFKGDWCICELYLDTELSCNLVCYLIFQALVFAESFSQIKTLPRRRKQ